MMRPNYPSTLCACPSCCAAFPDRAEAALAQRAEVRHTIAGWRSESVPGPVSTARTPKPPERTAPKPRKPTLAERVLQVLAQRPEGVVREDVRDAVGADVREVGVVLGRLLRQGKAQCEMKRVDGRTRGVWFAMTEVK